MKKLINDPFKVTVECIEGYVKAYPDLIKPIGTHVVVRGEAPIKDKVAVVIGGGSGHEPLFLGWVGYGMADAAVLGEVFAAPPPQFIVEATKAVNGGKGVVYIYGNYAGDRMNFDIAAEMMEVEGVKVESIRVWDDVASAPPERIQERRGLAGDLFVIKIAGAKAEEKASLVDVKRVAEKARDNCRTYAVGLSPPTIPASGKPTFTLGEDEMYLGIGAHGEKGVKIIKMLSADETAEILVNELIKELNLKEGDEVNVIINGYGSTTLMELYIVNRKVHQILSGLGIAIHRTEVGNFLTSQEMAGCSISLLKLDGELKMLYDAPAYTPTYRLCSIHR